MVCHKALLWGAEQRGKANPLMTLTSFQDDGGLFGMGALIMNWITGYQVNCGLRQKHVLEELHKDLSFEPGELMLVQGSSFAIFADLYNGTSHWSIIDANKGLVEEGYITVAQALAITRPSLWKGYEKRGGKPDTAKSD